MNVTSTQMRHMSGAQQPTSQPKTPSADATFGAHEVIADVATFSLGAAKGIVPLYGAYANFESFVVRGMFQPDNPQSKIAAGGILLNLAGTAALGAGILGGNSTATTIGGALLLGSAVTNGQAYL